MTTLTNSSEGGTNATAITAANSGGASGNAWDVVTKSGTGTTVTFDNSHPAHGTLGIKCLFAAVSSTACPGWTTSMGAQSQVWFRRYLYVTAYPTVNTRIWQADIGGTTLCASVYMMTNGTLLFGDTTSGTIFQTTTSVPLNQIVRVEGFLVGSTTVGQVELKLFLTADSTTADETHTSAATQNTGGVPNAFRYGMFSAVVQTTAWSLWSDDDGLSNTGYIGPPVVSGLIPQQEKQRAAYQVPGSRPVSRHLASYRG